MKTSLEINRAPLGILRRPSGLLALATTLMMLFGLALPVPAQDGSKETAKKIELDEANFLLSDFERYVGGLGGREGTLTPDAKRALTKISELKKGHPEDPRVVALFERAQAAARSLRGDRIEITDAILAYRDIETKKIGLLADQNRASWLDFQEKLLTGDEDVIAEAFPIQNPEATPLEEMEGRPIFLEGLRYPKDVFLNYGQQYVAIGSAAKGYYFVDVSSPSFISAYEAVRRYQREVSDKMPEEWIAVGKIVGRKIMVPGGGGADAGQAFPGWVVEVDTLYVPDSVFARADPTHELGGSFAGEDGLGDAFDALFTAKELPAADASAEELLRVFVTAIKEKNFDLYEQCIHPDERRTAAQLEWVHRKWDIFQRRFKEDLVEVMVGKIDEINILQGGAKAGEESLLAEFLDEKEVGDITDDGLPRSETITVWVKLYDETGRIRESQKALTLKRDEGVDGFRWFVYSGFPF